jgi:hypothetical protein
MTFTSIASKPIDRVDYELTAPNTPITVNRPEDSPQILKFSRISIAALILAVLGATFIPNLLWMQASHPAEVPCSVRQAASK